jgi:hypothetical protein
MGLFAIASLAVCLPVRPSARIRGGMDATPVPRKAQENLKPPPVQGIPSRSLANSLNRLLRIRACEWLVANASAATDNHGMHKHFRASKQTSFTLFAGPMGSDRG